MSKFKQSRVRQFVFSLYMSGFMSLLMSGIITLINMGLVPGFLNRWLAAFVVAWAVAFPLVMFIAPMAGRLADWTVARFSGASSASERRQPE